jgi:kumamolisin
MSTMSEERVELPGSVRHPVAQASEVGAVAADERIQVTLVLRRRAELHAAEVVAGNLTPEQLGERYGASPDDVVAVTAAVVAAGASVVEVDAASRRVRIEGTSTVLTDLFGTSLTRVEHPDPTSGEPVAHRQRTGALSVPKALHGIVVAVLGLDDRPQARAHFVLPHAAVTTSYTPVQLAKIYRLPTGTDGTGQTLAIIELGGGFAQSDLKTYFAGLGLAVPAVRAVGVDGATNVAGKDPTGADGEVLLDIEVAGAIVPKANIVVYFAPNTDAGFLDAISTAAHATPTPAAISISWGQSEDEWTAQARQAMDQAFADAAALGVTVTAAAGDNGSSDSTTTTSGVHVDFPASSPHVLACGGTSLHANTSTGAVSTEVVWNDGSSGGATGGGISDVWPLPSWQQTAGVPTRSGGGAGRGVPDVAADADPQTGYKVFVDGKSAVYGGTSAVAPLWAALTCRLAQSAGRRLGLLQPVLYKAARPGVAATGFRDITSGTNGSYRAAKGWDACTGLGVPDGQALAALFPKAARST